MTWLAWIGSFCLAICAVPQAAKSLKTCSSDGISWAFLSLWLVGEVCLLAYVVSRGEWALVMNYAGNIVCLLIILRFKFPI